MAATKNNLTWGGFALRLLFAVALVLATYNPSGYSFVDWVLGSPGDGLVYKALGGIVLLIGWAIYIRATKNSLGPFGTGLAVALLACLVWLLVDLGVFDPGNVTLMTWVLEIALAVVLAVGMSWSHIRRRLTGQVDTDEVDG